MMNQTMFPMDTIMEFFKHNKEDAVKKSDEEVQREKEDRKWLKKLQQKFATDNRMKRTII